MKLRVNLIIFFLCGGQRSLSTEIEVEVEVEVEHCEHVKLI